VRTTLETARKKYPCWARREDADPIHDVVANILNEKLNWTPVGLVRAACRTRRGIVRPAGMESGERAELYAKAIVGTIALGAMGELFGDHIHGNGPRILEAQAAAGGRMDPAFDRDRREVLFLHEHAGGTWPGGDRELARIGIDTGRVTRRTV
jgi:hypothetical protein